MTCNEPQCGLAEEDIAMAREVDTSSGILEFFSERPAFTTALIALFSSGIGFIAYTIKNKR